MLRTFVFLFTSACLVLAFFTGEQYPGHWLYYAAFTLAANALLFNGFRKSALFFDTFIGVFLWLGFWLKFSVRMTLSAGVFHEPVGLFDGSGAAYDRALGVAACGMAAVLLAGLIRERFFVYPVDASTSRQSALLGLYQRHRGPILAIFFLLVILVAATNSWLGIYQRGVVVQTTLPFGLNGVYKWLLQFGLASFCALIVRFEIEIHQRLSVFAVGAPIFETFFSNTSLLSRGMILNFSAVAVGVLRMFQTFKFRMNWVSLVITAVLFCAAFAGSVLAVNYLRASWQISESDAFNKRPGPEETKTESSNQDPVPAPAPPVIEIEKPSAASIVPAMTAPLFVDRWVGMEGVMAVSSYNGLGWELWDEAWQEQFREGTLSLYDRYFIKSPYDYAGIDRSKNHYISLPGIIAFLFYPGSILFLFGALFLLSLSASGIEILTYRFCGGNLILCSLFGQVIAFRFTSIGYVPNQSYLFFGSLVLNLFIIAAAEYHFRRRGSHLN